MVVNAVRGKDVALAQRQLMFMKRAAALPVLKLLNSAIANAENNNKLKAENLFIEVITVDQGPTLHRITPRAMGRSTPIRKRTSHISITLEERVNEEKAKKVIAKKAKTKDKKHIAPAKKKSSKTTL